MGYYSYGCGLTPTGVSPLLFLVISSDEELAEP